uniref:endo-polygalacturonase n=1 Tax=Kluyveromyces wickerhamii TaxID=51658 RepID=Q96VC1_9SACH|nr:polygalacturonase [Kluyveromyces wickerhamii]
MLFNKNLIILSSAILTSASPLEKRDSCTLTGSTTGGSGVNGCSAVIVKDVSVPAGKTLDLTGLKSGATVTFEGTTSFGYQEWEGPLISIAGSGITVTGASGNLIDGDGARWWDGKGDNGKTKPKLLKLKLTGDSVVSGLKIKNSPRQVVSVNQCSDLTIHDITIDNTDGDGSGKGHNTDGFDVGSSDTVTIKNCKVYNQDDCIAVNSGKNIYFQNNYCSGGHGISIGSVGDRSDNVVDSVWFENNQVVDSDNGLRIKTVQDATGKVNNVHFLDNEISNIAKYGIVVESDYKDGSTTGTPGSGVPITNLEINGVTGSVASSAKRVKILVAGASSWKWSNIKFTGGQSYSSCEGIPSGSGASC